MVSILSQMTIYRHERTKTNDELRTQFQFHSLRRRFLWKQDVPEASRLSLLPCRTPERADGQTFLFTKNTRCAILVEIKKSGPQSDH